MALRSALPFHNQWPTVNAPGQLPNDGSLTGIQSNAVQVGDICYERTGQVYYYCVVATVGAAVWQALGTVGPPLPDHQAHYYIVGNSLAGDTNSVCNFLDPGDGSGIAAALVAASSATPPRDVYVRPGTYTLIQQLDIAEGVRLLGAGRGRTRIIGYFDAPSIKMAPRGTELCDIDLVVQNSFATPAPGGFIDIRFNGVSANVEDPFAVRRVTIALQTISGSTGSPLAGIHLGGNDVDFVAEGNAVEDVVATTLTQQSYSPGTTYADMVVGLRGSVLAANLQPVWPRVNITNLCVEDWQGCTYLDGVNGAHRMCQYDGIRIASWTPLAGVQVGFYATANASESTYDACDARIAIPLSAGFLLSGVDRPETDSIAINSCSTFYDPATLGAGGVGFQLDTNNLNDRLDTVRMYCNFVETAALGYTLASAVANTVAIGNGTISCTVPVTDLGSFNDFGHLQAH